MSDIIQYYVEIPPNRDPVWGPGTHKQACNIASSRRGIVVAYHYELSDSEMVDDFREDEEE